MFNFETARVGGAGALGLIQTTGELSNGEEMEYGLGLHLFEYRGSRGLGHSGGVAEFRSNLAYFPEHRFGVALWGNSVTFSDSALLDQVIDIYLGDCLEAEPENEIYAESETSFVTKNGEMRVSFSRNEEKANGGLIVSEGGEEQTGQRVVQPPSEILAQYIGRYYCDTVDTVWEIEDKDGKLAIQHFRLSSLPPLTYLEKDKCSERLATQVGRL